VILFDGYLMEMQIVNVLREAAIRKLNDII